MKNPITTSGYSKTGNFKKQDEGYFQLYENHFMLAQMPTSPLIFCLDQKLTFIILKTVN